MTSEVVSVCAHVSRRRMLIYRVGQQVPSWSGLLGVSQQEKHARAAAAQIRASAQLRLVNDQS